MEGWQKVDCSYVQWWRAWNQSKKPERRCVGLQSWCNESGNYSHMDGGVMDGWWRYIGDDGDEDLLQIPVPAGCQNRVSGSESRFLMVAAQRKSIREKHRTPAPFRSEGICRRKEGSRRWPRWPHHRWARPGLGHAPGGEPGSQPLSISSSSSVGLLVK
jgi:hypothetical protein